MKHFFFFILWFTSLAPLFAQDKDFGDAPCGDTVMTYDSTKVARFVTNYTPCNSVISPMHPQGTWVYASDQFWLGQVAPTPKDDSAQDPQAPENDSKPRLMLQNWGTNPLADLVIGMTAAPTHSQNQPLYLNVLLDQNRDGQFKDGYDQSTSQNNWYLEWCVQDLPLYLAPGTSQELAINNLRVFIPNVAHWIRIVLTDKPIRDRFAQPLPGATAGSARFWDGSLPDSHDLYGEVEDFLLSSVMTQLDDIPEYGIFFPGRKPALAEASCKVGSLRFVNSQFSRKVGVASHLITVPFCTDSINVNYGLSFKYQDCAADSNVLIAQYGPTKLWGTTNTPVFNRNTSSSASSLSCTDGTLLRSPSSLGQEPLMTSDRARPGQAYFPSTERLWNVCFSRDTSASLYASYLRTMSCGNPTNSINLAPLPESAQNYASASVRKDLVTSTGNFGEEVDLRWISFGRNLLVPITPNYATPTLNKPFVPLVDSTSACLDTLIAPPVHTGGLTDTLALRVSCLGEHQLNYQGLGQDTMLGGWVANWDELFEPRHIRYKRLGEMYYVKAGGLLDGARLEISVDYDTLQFLNTWEYDTLTLPQGFELGYLKVSAREGYVDSIHVDLARKEVPLVDEYSIEPNQVALIPGDTAFFYLGQKNALGELAADIPFTDWDCTGGVITPEGMFVADSAAGFHRLYARHNGQEVSALVLVLDTNSTQLPQPNLSNADQVTSYSFRLFWDEVPDAERYYVDVALDENFTQMVSGYENVETRATELLVTGLPQTTRFYCRLRARAQNFVSESSRTLSILTRTLQPPFTFELGANYQNSFTVNWSAANFAEEYFLEASPSSQFDQFLPGYEPKTLTALTDSLFGLPTGSTYFLRIRSHDGYNLSDYSDTLEVSVGVVALEDDAARQVRVTLFPNPSEGQVTLYFHDAAAQQYEFSMRLINLQGQEVLHARNTPKALNTQLNTTLQGVRAGIYILELEGNGQRAQFKIVRY